LDKIKKHYKEQAEKYGTSKQMSMKDTNTRDMEVEEIIKYLRIIKTNYRNPKILEIGCGNGYTAGEINEKLNLGLIGIDFSEDLIRIAKSRKLDGVEFIVGNVLNMQFPDETFDIVFTERCLINLDSWKKQQKALNEIRRVLKVGGGFLMIEAFTDGLDNLNEARKVVGLDTIPQPFHNLYFDKLQFLQFIKGKFEKHVNLSSSENFLSSYYFGSRVLYPALIAGKKEVIYNNKFVEFFKYLSSYGNYSPIQLFALKKT